MSINFSMGFSCGEEFDKREKEIILTDESRETRERISMDAQHPELELEFWPVEHPLEPQDEDRPVKCPIPAPSSVINESKKQEERLADSFKKRAEVPGEIIDREGIDVNIDPPIRVVRKRHHTLTHCEDDEHHHHHHHHHHHTIKPLMRMPPLPPLQTQKFTIYEMLQDFDKFES